MLAADNDHGAGTGTNTWRFGRSWRRSSQWYVTLSQRISQPERVAAASGLAALPRGGGADYDVGTPYREGDLDPANVPPFPIDMARAMRVEQA